MNQTETNSNAVANDISPVGPLHFMSWERFAAHAQQHKPGRRPNYYADMYGNANRIFESVIHYTPSIVLEALFFRAKFKPHYGLKQTIRFLKADVARRRAERFGPGVE